MQGWPQVSERDLRVRQRPAPFPVLRRRPATLATLAFAPPHKRRLRFRKKETRNFNFNFGFRKETVGVSALLRFGSFGRLKLDTIQPIADGLGGRPTTVLPHNQDPPFPVAFRAALTYELVWGQLTAQSKNKTKTQSKKKTKDPIKINGTHVKTRQKTMASQRQRRR